jgi:ComF family protein
MLSRFRQLKGQVFSRLPALVPSSCALCGSAGNDTLCDGCHRQYFQRHQHRCVQCAMPLATAATVCGECLKQPPAFDATIAAADYVPPVDQLVLALKFGNRLALAPLFARMLRDAVPRGPGFALPMLLTAVPLGSQRLMERGYNQALEIARPMSRALGVPLEPALAVRLRDTDAQAMLHPDERRQNIRGAFIVPDHAIDKVRGRHIGVVDDVITTGETLNELAATLKRFGATRVTNFVFARTLQK